jgi:hypothetical protein
MYSCIDVIQSFHQGRVIAFEVAKATHNLVVVVVRGYKQVDVQDDAARFSWYSSCILNIGTTGQLEAARPRRSHHVKMEWWRGLIEMA